MSDEKPATGPEALALTPEAKAADGAAADGAATDGAATDGAATDGAAAGEARADGATTSPEEPASRKRKRKRKKLEEPLLRNSLGPDGRERPAFLLGFPEDPELERVMRAFELGNYALVRKSAPELAERTTDPKVRAAAEELARRIEPDPLVKILLGLSLALLVVLTLWAYKTHGG